MGKRLRPWTPRLLKHGKKHLQHMCSNIFMRHTKIHFKKKLCTIVPFTSNINMSYRFLTLLLLLMAFNWGRCDILQSPPANVLCIIAQIILKQELLWKMRSAFPQKDWSVLPESRSMNFNFNMRCTEQLKHTLPDLPKVTCYNCINSCLPLLCAVHKFTWQWMIIWQN